MKNKSIILFSIFFSSIASSQTITEWYFQQSASTVHQIEDNKNPLTIHSGNNQPFPTDKAFFSFVNIVNSNYGGSIKTLPTDIWSGLPFTGLNPINSNNSQAGLSYNFQMPSYGNNLVQLSNGDIGMLLNTWGLNPPNPALTSAIQFTRHFSPARSIWNQTDTTSSLCSNALIDLHSWEGPTTQAMTTLFFGQTGSNNFFAVNIMILDTNVNNRIIESVIDDNPLDTGAPIAITHYKTQGQNGRYSGPIQYYGNQLQPYSSVATKAPSNTSEYKHYGFCISKNQFQNILDDIRAKRPYFSNNPSDYGLSLFIYSPEIHGYNGMLGMSVKSSGIYRVSP